MLSNNRGFDRRYGATEEEVAECRPRIRRILAAMLLTAMDQKLICSPQVEKSLKQFMVLGDFENLDQRAIDWISWGTWLLMKMLPGFPSHRTHPWAPTEPLINRVKEWEQTGKITFSEFEYKNEVIWDRELGLKVNPKEKKQLEFVQLFNGLRRKFPSIM
jgi:hypothetical protein